MSNFTEKAASPKAEEPKPEAMEVGSTQVESDSEDEDVGGDDEDDEGGKDEGESTVVEDSAASSSSNLGLNLAGFLFGNIDDEGKLSDDHSFLDSDTRAKLGGLSQLLGAADSEILKVRLKRRDANSQDQYYNRSETAHVFVIV